MNKDVAVSFESHFGTIKDNRIDRHKLYPLTEILFVVLQNRARNLRKNKTEAENRMWYYLRNL